MCSRSDTFISFVEYSALESICIGSLSHIKSILLIPGRNLLLPPPQYRLCFTCQITSCLYNWKPQGSAKICIILRIRVKKMQHSIYIPLSLFIRLSTSCVETNCRKWRNAMSLYLYYLCLILHMPVTFGNFTAQYKTNTVLMTQ